MRLLVVTLLLLVAVPANLVTITDRIHYCPSEHAIYLYLRYDQWDPQGVQIDLDGCPPSLSRDEAAVAIVQSGRDVYPYGYGIDVGVYVQDVDRKHHAVRRTYHWLGFVGQHGVSGFTENHVLLGEKYYFTYLRDGEGAWIKIQNSNGKMAQGVHRFHYSLDDGVTWTTVNV
jgi:hypothetical protein